MQIGDVAMEPNQVPWEERAAVLFTFTAALRRSLDTAQMQSGGQVPWEERAAVLLTFTAACLRSSLDCTNAIWLSGTLGGACSCTAHVHGGMFET